MDYRNGSPNGYGFLGQLKLAPDQKIYLSRWNQDRPFQVAPNSYYSLDSLDVIKQPNAVGFSCNFQRNYIYLDHKTTMIGLPNFISNFTGPAPLANSNVPSVDIIASQNNICRGTSITFTATPANAEFTPTYQWRVNENNIGANDPVFTSNTLADGDIVDCIMIVNNSCFLNLTDTSNKIPVVVKPTNTAVVNIVANDTTICYGDRVIFTATSSNGGNAPSYQWKINGKNTGTNDSIYVSNTLQNGDTINCMLTNNIDCIVSFESNNPIIMNVTPAPTVTDGSDKIIQPGTSIALNLSVTGNIINYLWTPATGLSDISVKNPVATPTTNTTYTLEVTANNRCRASGKINVNVFNNLVMPTAFTPNNDGVNDLFRIPATITVNIRYLAIFDRWGNKVFFTTNAKTGWDGIYNDYPQPNGTYVWVLEYIDPLKQIPLRLKGNILLIR